MAHIAEFVKEDVKLLNFFDFLWRRNRARKKFDDSQTGLALPWNGIELAVSTPIIRNAQTSVFRLVEYQEPDASAFRLVEKFG